MHLFNASGFRKFSSTRCGYGLAPWYLLLNLSSWLFHLLQSNSWVVEFTAWTLKGLSCCPDLQNDHYGKDAAVLVQLEITFPDSSRDVIVTDTSWRSTTGPIRYADLYTGEEQDTRIMPGPWASVTTGEGPGNNLVASISEPVREHENFHLVRIFSTLKGDQVLDFGQNLAGWVRFTAKGSAGDTVRLAHAETLDADSNFYTGNLRLATAEDVYVLSGAPQELEPHFTYHGFRYVRVEGYPGRLKRENFTAVALYSDLAATGYFECSNSLLNQLQSNIIWSQKSNLFDIPTDCPQRSERFGWAGDAQVFCRTAAFNQDVKTFFTKWLEDLSSQQGTNGGLPIYVPDFRTPDSVGPRGGVAGWGMQQPSCPGPCLNCTVIPLSCASSIRA
jgi:alpha-L-rhamnosidase